MNLEVRCSRKGLCRNLFCDAAQDAGTIYSVRKGGSPVTASATRRLRRAPLSVFVNCALPTSQLRWPGATLPCWAPAEGSDIEF